MPTQRPAHVRLPHRPYVALGAALAVLLSLVGAAARPAAAGPVFQNDTQRSGPAFGVGRNDFGQTNPASTTSPSTSFSALPAGGGATLTDAVSVAAGNGFALWTDHLGKVWSIGDNGNGKRGNGTTGGVDRVPVAAAGFGGSGQPKAVKVASFGLAVDVLDSNGDVWQWGQVVNNNSTLAVQSAPSKLSFPGASRIIDVSAGESFSVALDLSGKVYTWGKGDRGQLGTGTTNTSPYPAQIPSGTKAGQLPVPPANASVWVEAGRDFAVYTVSNPGGGVDVWTWGRGDLYQQANAKTLDQKSPVKVALTTTGEKVRSLSAGTSHALLLTTSNSGVPVLRWWGTQALGSSSQVAQTPTTITAAAATSPHVPISVTAGDSASFVASSDGTVASWGKGANGQLGTGATGDVTAPALTTIPGALPLRQSGVPVTMVSRAGATYAVVNADITSSPDMTGLPYSFGYYPVNPDVPGSSAQHGFTFTNVATRDLTGLTASILTDKDVPSSTSTEFAVTGSTCANPFPVSSTCTVTVSFAPTTTTGSTAYLVLATTNTGVPVLRSAVKLSGQGYTSQKGLTNYSLTVQGPPSVGGPGNVIDLRTLNPKLIPESIQETTGTASLTKLPLAELSLTKLPTSTASLTKISLTKLSLTKISLTKLSLTKISLTKLPVTSLTKLSLTKISLTKLPLQRLGGWEDLLQAYPNLAKIPVSSLTVADLVNPALNQPADPSTGLPLERVSLGDLDVRNSALANVSFLSLLQGGMRLGQYPVDWCTELPQVPNGGHCTDGSGLNRTLFELSLSNPIDIGLTSVGNVTVGQLRTDAQSASGNPLDDTAWGDILLASTTLSGTHVGDIALASIPDLSKVLDCSRTSCTSTAGRHLGDNDVVGALKPDAVFKDLGSALNPLKLMYLVEPFLDRSSFDWESLPRTAIPLAAYPNRYNVTASAMVNCDHAAAMTFGFALPSGFTYVPGTATLDTSPTTSIGLSDPTNPPSDSPDRGLVLSVPGLQRNGGSLPCVNDGFGVTVHLGVLPTSAPGSGYKATGDVRTSDLGPLSGTQAGNGITVTGVNQPPDDTPTGPVGREDTLILGHVNAGQTAQYVPVDVPEGKIIEATLSGLDANPDPATDLDLTLYYPKGAGAERALSGSGSPVQVPFGESQVVEPDRGHPRASASGGALQDVPLRTDRLVAAVSATRGHDLEQLSAIARKGDDSRHLLAITSFNGSSGDFTVRMRVLDPPSLASCGTVPRTVGSPASTTLYQHAGDAAGFRSTDSTVVLVNASRQQAYYGDSAGVLESAYQFTHSANGVKGQVLQVDSDPSVRAAYANWDAHPCDPLASNQVVRAINDLVLANVDTKKIKYVNVLGAHPVIPYAWLEDHTRDGSEREEAGDLTFKDGNPIAMASALGYFASDDPYGTFVPIAVLGQVVYSPQAVTGRIGEASADIKSQLSLFQTPTAVAAAGVADPRTASSEPRSAVVTDYDFLAPGGTRTANALTASGYAVDHTLSGAAARWTKADLDAAWLERSPMPAVAALNMHYDQYRALPAYGAATNSLNELYTARGDVDAAASLARRVVYTAGCHSALGVPDDYAIAGDDRAHDFAQAYGAKGLAVMVGNFGYGYADSDTVAYSARLQALFSERTSSTDLGTALVLAKRRYLATLSSLSPYDLKSMQQMVLWGVAQYRFPGVAAPGQAVSGQAFGPSSAAADPVTGLPSQAFSVGTSANELRFANPDGSSVYSNGSLTPPADDGTPTFVSAQATDPAVADHDPATVSSAGHPVLAAQFVDLPSLTDSSGNPLVVRSVVPRALTSVRTYASTTRFAAADSDHDLNLGDASEGEYPATLGHQWNLPTGDGWSSTFVMTPEQVFLDGTAPGHASVRLYSRSDWVALLGPPATPAPDSVRTVSAARTGTTTRYSVDITPAAGRQTTSVYVLALPSQGYGSWVRTTLQQDSLHPGHWTGEAAGSLGAFGVVSSNDGGWSAISNLKGLGWQPTDLAPGGDDFSNFVLPDPGPSGWYTSYPTSSTTPGWTAYVDGAPVAPTYTFADGDHLVRLQRPDGTFAVGHLEVKVDTVVPTVLITLDGSPAASSPTFADDANLHHVALRSLHPLSITATAGPSGYVLSTQGTAPYGSGLKVDTSALGAPPGGQVLSGSATSGAGLVGTATYLYRVVYGSASFVAPTQSTNTVLPVLAYQYAFQVFDGASPATEVKTAPTGSFAASFAADTGCAPPGSINLPSGIASGSPSYNGTKWVWSLVAPLGGCQKLTGRLNDGYTKITTLVVL